MWGKALRLTKSLIARSTRSEYRNKSKYLCTNVSSLHDEELNIVETWIGVTVQLSEKLKATYSDICRDD